MPEVNADKNVYILGAGFSRDLGLPLQNDFLLTAKEVYFRDQKKYKHFESVFNYQDDLSKMRKFLNYPLLNLEHLFNIMEMDMFYSTNEKVKSIKGDFVNLIRDVLMEQTPVPFYNDERGQLIPLRAYDPYLSFLNLFPRKGDRGHLSMYGDTIITFNYDLVVEAAVSQFNWKNDEMREHKQPYYFLRLNTMVGKSNIISENIDKFFVKDGKPAFCPPVDIFSDEESAIKLIKLHGSINWKTFEDGDTKPFIVPPTWNKSDDRVKKLWEIAYQELTQAKRIIIIGYSFPETDIYVKSLLALALNENRILQKVYFINPDKGDAKQNCLSLLDAYFQHFCDYKELTFREVMTYMQGGNYDMTIGRKY